MDSKSKQKPKQQEKPPKEPKKKKEKQTHFCHIMYHMNYPEEEREKLFTVTFN